MRTTPANALRTAILVLASAGASLATFAQSVSLEAPAVSSEGKVKELPLDRWAAEGNQAHIRWTSRVMNTELSSHQRLRARVEIEVDGAELVKRKGNGYLIMAVQLHDSQNRAYQIGKAIDLSRIEDTAGKTNLIYSQDALVTPGSYRITLGIIDTTNGEHSVSQRMLNVSPIKGDPLPAAWRDLPPVELLQDIDPPDSLYLPYAAGRLNLPLETQRPVRIELLVNASPSPTGRNPLTAKETTQSRDELIPPMKVISQIAVANGVLNISMLDLTRRKVVFEQNGVRDHLDWGMLRQALGAADPNLIDVHSLEKRGQNAQFFLTEVGRKIAGAAAPEARPGQPVLIVLSGPMTLDSGEDLHPLKASDRPAGGVYYIRYHSVPVRQPFSPIEDPRRGRRGFPTAPMTPVLAEPLDTLERTLKPLQPRVFDIYNPEQFRKAMATVLAEISRM